MILQDSHKRLDPGAGMVSFFRYRFGRKDIQFVSLLNIIGCFFQSHGVLNHEVFYEKSFDDHVQPRF